MSTLEREQLAPGDHVFLCFLLSGPRTAYDIKRAMERTVNYFWYAAHSQVYQQASRLVRDGYVKEKATAGPRGKKLLSLTSRGDRAVRAWLRAPAALPRVYAEPLVKLFFAGELDEPAATVAMLEDSRARAAAALDGLLALEGPLSAPEHEYHYLTLRSGIAYLRSAIEWHDETLARLRRRAQEKRRPKRT